MSNSFDEILMEIVKQKQVLQELKQENTNLRQQLADLRSGRGFQVAIEGTQLPLQQGSIPGYHAIQEEPLIQKDTQAEPKALPVPKEKPPAQPATPVALEPEIIPEAPKVPKEQPRFLEEMMLDEFTRVATAPMTVWNSAIARPVATKKIPAIHAEVKAEEEKAQLRRALSGSFMLE